MARLARLNIGAGRTFHPDALSPEIRHAVTDSIEDAWGPFDDVRAKIDVGQVAAGDAVGTRDYLKNNYPYRMAAAIGIYGNSKEEAFYALNVVDSSGAKLDPWSHPRHRPEFPEPTVVAGGTPGLRPAARRGGRDPESTR